MDTSLNLILQQFSPALDGVMRLISLFGQEEVFVIIVGVLYWCVDSGLGVRLMWVVVFSSYTNSLVKWVFHLPRPYWIDTRVKAISTEVSYGLPSGHSQSSFTAYGYLASQLKRRWLWIAAGVLIVGVAVSRLYLGVHFALDILGGWCVGLIVLVVFTRLQAPVARWAAAKPIGLQIIAVVGFSISLLVLMVIVRAAIANVIDPPGWPVQAGPIDPRNLDIPIADQGLLLGGGLGLILMRRTARFDVRGSRRQYALRLLIGALGVVIIRFGLGALLPREPSETAEIFRYLRYALIALWALWLAPWTFIKLNLAQAR